MVGKPDAQRPFSLYIQDVQLYPDIKTKEVLARVTVLNNTGKLSKRFAAITGNGDPNAEKVNLLSKEEIEVTGDSSTIEIKYPMGASTFALGWVQTKPVLYESTVATGNG